MRRGKIVCQGAFIGHLQCRSPGSKRRSLARRQVSFPPHSTPSSKNRREDSVIGHLDEGYVRLPHLQPKQAPTNGLALGRRRSGSRRCHSSIARAPRQSRRERASPRIPCAGEAGTGPWACTGEAGTGPRGSARLPYVDSTGLPRLHRSGDRSHGVDRQGRGDAMRRQVWISESSTGRKVP